MSTDIEWQNLLIDVAIGRNQHWIQSEHRGLRIKEVDSVIASGLLIRSVSILDVALSQYIDKHKITIKDKNPKLYHRLKALENKGLVADYRDIDSWRKRRNDVGHKVADTYTWEEVDACLESTYRELNNLGMLSNFPRLSARKTTHRVEPSAPNVSIEQLVKVQIHDEETVYYEFGWNVQVGNLPDRSRS